MTETVNRYETPADAAARIRAAYKAKGWNQRKIGVRSESFSMGSSVTVEIRSPEVDEAEAKRIAESAERISRCEITGEILSGGNRFVHVGYSAACREILARRHQGELERAVRALDPADASRHEQLSLPGGEDVSVAFEGSRAGGWFQLWIDGRPGLTFPSTPQGLASGAFELARILSRKAGEVA